MIGWWTGTVEALQGSDAVDLRVPDPDRGPAVEVAAGGGSLLNDDFGSFRYRPWRVWVDLAEALGARIGTPKSAPDGMVTFRIARLLERPRDPDDPVPSDPYAEGGAFWRMNKLEDAASLRALVEAIGRAELAQGERVLVLGAHRGDELAALAIATGRAVEDFDVVAVERSPTAVAAGRRHWPTARWIEADVAAIESWELGRFELLVAIGLLQSPSVDRHALSRTLLKSCVADRATAVIGLPNSRLIGGGSLWGARTLNVGPVEMGLVVRDAAATRRLLQQQRFRVFVTGKYDLLVTGVRR